MPTYKYTPRRSVNNIVPKPETTEPKQDIENISIENTTENTQVQPVQKDDTPIRPIEFNKPEEKKSSFNPVPRNTEVPTFQSLSKEQVSKPQEETKTPLNEINFRKNQYEQEDDFSTPLTLESIEDVEELSSDELFSMTQPVKEKPQKQIKTKTPKQKNKTRKKIKVSPKTIKKLIGLVVIIGVMFFIINGLSNVLSSSKDSYTITNEHLKNRVVQGINPGELIDIKNSLPLQITAKDLVITDFTPEKEREIILWDYTNTNLNKVNILVDGKVVKENIVLKKKPISITIPAQCRLEVQITDEVSSEYMSYAMQVGNNTYFNKLSTTRGNILYFTNPLLEEK